jgi:tetratricopeptide (TPR) repeat protein
LLQTSSGLRSQFWLAAAGQLVAPEAKAREWFDRVKPLINAGSEEEQLALAGAYASAANRFKASSAQWTDEALAAVRRVTARADASARAWEAQGSLLQSAGKPEATAAFQKALDLDPKSIFALRGLASATTDPQEAVRLTSKVLEITGPRDPVSQLQHGQALAAVARQLTDQAAKKAQFAKAAEALAAGGAGQSPNLSTALVLIEALDNAGKVGETIPIYDNLLARSDLPPGARAALQNNLADSIVRAGRTGAELDRAHALVEQATTAQPNAAFFDTMGMVEKARGERALAITAYRKAVAMDQSAWGSWVSLAELLKTGTPEEQVEAKRIVETLRKAGEAIPNALRERIMVLGQE